MLATILECLAFALVLVGIRHEEKLIAFEDKVAEFVLDRTAYYIAKIIVAYRKKTGYYNKKKVKEIRRKQHLTLIHSKDTDAA